MLLWYLSIHLRCGLATCETLLRSEDGTFDGGMIHLIPSKSTFFLRLLGWLGDRRSPPVAQTAVPAVFKT